jgi:imidazolonepropionase-like amidohydrolase
MLFNRMDLTVFQAVAQQSKSDGLPIVVHTGNAKDVDDAVAAGVNGLEHGSLRDRISDETFARMAKAGIAYDPTLSVFEAFGEMSKGSTALMDRSLLAQAVPNSLLVNTKKQMGGPQMAKMRENIAKFGDGMAIAQDNLLRAWKAGVPLVTGSDAGNMLVFHGPTVQHEMKLWVQAGIPAGAALQAATYNAAKLLRTDKRMGLIKKGYDANLLLVDGNPLQDISATEQISSVFLKGERVDRSSLFE